MSVSGTLIGPKQLEKIVEVDGFAVELPPTSHMVFLRYEDRPGVVGTLGRILGEAQVNIAGMQVSRDDQGRARAGGDDSRLRGSGRRARADRVRDRGRQWPPGRPRELMDQGRAV